MISGTCDILCPIEMLIYLFNCHIIKITKETECKLLLGLCFLTKEKFKGGSVKG
jgi:hypothetical protein